MVLSDFQNSKSRLSARKYKQLEKKSRFRLQIQPNRPIRSTNKILAKSRSPPQELEVRSRSGLYVLVVFKTEKTSSVLQQWNRVSKSCDHATVRSHKNVQVLRKIWVFEPEIT